jgi:glycopeptide antibiotics resistance protein
VPETARDRVRHVGLVLDEQGAQPPLLRAVVSPGVSKIHTSRQHCAGFNGRVRLFVGLIVTSAAVVGCPGAAWAADDPCGGTGGIGTIVRAGNDSFTMRRNDDGAKQLVHLAHPTAIETATGSMSASRLSPGDRVTLVGDPNPDGSFTAATVVVCEPRQTARPVPFTSAADSKQADAWGSRIDRAALLLVGVTWIGMLAMLRARRRQGLVDLLFFTIFFVYIVLVLDRTLFQFQALIVLKHFAPYLMLNGQGDGNTVNLVPLVKLRQEDVVTSLLNVLLMVPFGFGLPFVTKLRFTQTVVAGVLFSVGIEVLQWMTGLIGGVTFRIADINDVIFNAAGVVIGYGLFVGFVRAYRRRTGEWKLSTHPISRHISERTQV